MPDLALYPNNDATFDAAVTQNTTFIIFLSRNEKRFICLNVCDCLKFISSGGCQTWRVHRFALHRLFFLFIQSFLIVIDLLQGCQPVTLIIDEANIYVLREMYHLPFTRNRLSKKQTYFNHENTIPIDDIANLVR